MPRIKVVPIGDRVLVGEVQRREKSAGGVVLPEAVRESWHDEGTIVRFSGILEEEEKDFGEMAFTKGSRIVYSAAGSTEIKIDGETFRILPTKNILAVLIEEPSE